MLGPNCEQATIEALQAFPNGFHVGGGINNENAKKYLEAGASHVIVTSYVFIDDRLVLDLSCRKKPNDINGYYYVVTNKWTKYTDFALTYDNLSLLSQYCSEFLVHGVDVEGKRCGIEIELVKLLGEYSTIPVTYAGGIRSIDDLELVNQIGNGKVDCTIGSSLDIFGGPTGEDPLQMYIESLVDEADEIAIRYNKSKPTEILTDIPRGKKIKKGQLIGRKANYRDFEITLLKKEPLDKSNREWKEYGNKTLFSELMSLVNSNPSILQSNTSLTKQSTQPKLVDLIDSFFITEDVLSSIGDQIASNVMNQVYNTSLLGVKTSNDFNIIQEKLIIPTRVTESQSKPVNNTKSVTKDNLNTYLTNENELLPSTLTGKSLTNTRVNNINNNKELKETYPMSLNTAVKTLKFMVEHPITDYTESLGHGMNLKENMEVLRSFVRPHTALKGLESIVNDVINDIDK
eukprot:gene20846-27016_t